MRGTTLLDNHLGGITGLDSKNGELNAEGGSREGVVTVEEVTETGEGHVSELCSNLGKDESMLGWAR